jgi:predicted molibdopterin-dependent oxidoreductase YjgC
MFKEYFIFDFITVPYRLLGSMIKKACKIVAESWDEAKKNYK